MIFQYFNNVSINKKLAGIIIFSCLLISLLSSSFFIGQQITSHSKSMVEDLSGLAKVLAINCTAPLEFNDQVTAGEILSSLTVRPHILQAGLYTVEGKLFAKYNSPFIISQDHLELENKKLFDESPYFHKSFIRLSVPIGEPGNYIGALVLISDQSAYRAIITRLVFAVCGILTATLLLAAFFSVVLNRVISSPIRTLAEIVARVHQKEDYSIRATQTSSDEIGMLVQGVNSMLEGIEQRDEQLLVSKTIAEDANKAKSQFLAQMSHEIRTPMNGVLGITSLLSRTSLNEKQTELVRIIHRSGKLLLNLINDILDFSKIEAGKLELEEIDFSLKGVVEETVALLSERAREKDIILSCDIQPSLPPYVVGDPGRLSQILMNLLGNAIKFTHHGEIFLTVSFEELQESGIRVLFSVKDSGVGIEKEKQELIFGAFAQADGSTTRQFGGTGLGLAICRGLVRVMNGEIWVESSEGCGATFCFTALFTVGSAKELTEDQPQITVSGKFNASILVAEDNITNQIVAIGMLEHLGCRVEVVGHGLEAVKSMEKKQYDLIFMDCQMPVMNGYEATEKIRKMELQQGREKTPVIALTAQAMKGDREHCLAVGMDDYITKPITEIQLGNILSNWLPRQGIALPGVQIPTTAMNSNGESGFVHIDKNRIDMLTKLRQPGKPDVSKRLVASYRQSTQEILQELKEAAKKNDNEILWQSAHSLKSSSTNFGATHLSTLCRQLEISGRENRVVNPIQTIQEIEVEFNAVAAELEQIVLNCGVVPDKTIT